VLCAVLLGAGVSAVAEDERREQQTRKTPALTERAYKKLAEAQEFIDAKDYPGALEALEDMANTRGMNAYELASMENMRAFVAFSIEDYGLAIRAYEGVLSYRPDIPLALEVSALYALGQLYFVEEDYERALGYLDEWFAVTENPNPQAYLFKAQAMYQLARYADIPPIVYEAMDVARERDQEVQENWWLLIRAAYYELEDWDNVLAILEILVRDFPKKEYWVQLSGIYGQEERGREQVAAIWTAYIQGFLDQEREIMNVAGLLLQEEVPYFAATILEAEIENGVVEETAKNLQMLAQSWQLAQEVDRAIPVYRAAAELSDEGELSFRLAQLYLEKDQCAESVEAASDALEKGGLKNEAQVLLVKGMCQYELREYAAAIETFSQGQRVARREGFDVDLRALNNWKRYVENEQAREEQLARAAS
jgi:hypothetical protein